MNRWSIAGLIVLLIGLGVAVALLNLNSLISRNRAYLLSQAEQALDRKISVGDVVATLWGGIGLRLRNVAISDDPSFHTGDFIRAGDLQVNVRLLPLLTKKIQIKRLILHDPVIEIVRDKTGEFNFSRLGKGKTRSKGKPASGRKSGGAANEGIAPFLAVSLLEISNGAVHYLDRKEELDLLVKGIDFRVKELDFNHPFHLKLAAALFSEKQNVHLQAVVGPLPSNHAWTEAPLDGQFNVDVLDLDRLSSGVPKLAARLPKDLRLSGLMKIKDMRVQGTVQRPDLTGTLEATNATITFGKTFHKTSGIPFIFFTETEYRDDTLSFTAKLALHTAELTGKGGLKWGAVPSANLSIHSSRASLAGWDKILPILNGYQLSGNFEVRAALRGKIGKGASPEILGSLILAGVSGQPPKFPKPVKDLNARIDFAGQRAEVKGASLSLGSSTIRLAAQIERFSPLALSYQLSSPELRPADFQAPLPDQRNADVFKNVSSEGSLRTNNGSPVFQGRIASNQGLLYRTAYKDLATVLSWENKTANIRKFRVNALDGTLQTEGEYSFKDTVPHFSLAFEIEGVDLRELYRAVEPGHPMDIQGRLNADFKISGSGKGWKEIKPSLRGQGQAEVLQGALLNFNLAESLASAITGVPGLTSLVNPQVRKKYPETFEAKDTVFKELSGIFDLGESRMKVKNLRITAADSTVQGSGWVDFDRKIDFRTLLLFSERLSADLAHTGREVKYIFNDQNQFEMPFSVTGTLPRIRPRPDSGYLVQMIQRGMAVKGAEELRRRLFGTKNPIAENASPSDLKGRQKGRTEETIRKGLEGLFRR